MVSDRNPIPSLEDYLKEVPHPDRKCIGFDKNKTPVAKKPLVSVITIVRNGEKTIERTIKSVLDQDYQPIEYIIIDGASSDKTFDVVKKYESKISLAISEPDRGIFDAYNKGIALCSGQLIGMLNADDWYNQSTVKKAVGAYELKPNSIIHGKLQYWNSPTQPHFILGGNPEFANISATVLHPTTFIPKTVLMKIGLFRTNFKIAGDFELFARAKSLSVPFHYIDEVLTNMSLYGISDRRWISAYYETFKARQMLGMGPFYNSYILSKMFLLTLTRRALEAAGLSTIVKFYRKHLSSLDKTYFDQPNN